MQQGVIAIVIDANAVSRLSSVVSSIVLQFSFSNRAEKGKEKVFREELILQVGNELNRPIIIEDHLLAGV